jgi:hypothetical protein
MDEIVNVSLKLEEVDVKLVDLDGTPRNWKLKELDGEQREKYLNDISRRITGTGKDARFNSYKGVYSSLLSMCLYDESDTLVKAGVIEKMPSKALEVLFERARTLSGLNKEGEDQAKND